MPQTKRTRVASKMVPISVAKSQCCTVTCVFDRDILAREAASVTGVVCTNSASGTMDHTKGVDATTQEQRSPCTRTDSTYRLSQVSKRARTSVPKWVSPHSTSQNLSIHSNHKYKQLDVPFILGTLPAPRLGLRSSGQLPSLVPRLLTRAMTLNP